MADNSQRLGDLLDALAVLKELERHLTAAEQFLRAGAAVALGANKHDMAAVVYLSTEYGNVPERYFQRELARPERAADEMADRWEQYGPPSREPKPPDPFTARQRSSDLER